MSKIRVLVQTRKVGALAIDHIVNTVHFDDFNIDPTAGTNWQAFANDVRGVFAARGEAPLGYEVSTKVYDLADAEPRPVKASSTPVGMTQAGTGSGPREVALCLSYFSERNLPRFRGRLYIGPFGVGAMAERPGVALVTAVKNLSTGLANIGGVDVDWGLWSPTRNAFSKITGGWVDDEWDTVRSRGLRATTRQTYTTSE